jgi:Vault protein inter-alpha-trypsin domain/von Willebrand factor type A domain
MNPTRVLPADDPLRIYPAGAFLRDTILPVPLTDTRFAVTIRGGVAMVETWRTLRNADHRSIEVTLTMPMPVRAVLYSVVVNTDGRSLRAACQPRDKAIASYEKDGVNEGKLAVLHEEVLSGVHKLSVANIAPGSAISVQCAWATFLVPSADGRAAFRLPLTVGDIYGRSPLSDADDLVSGGATTRGRLTVDGDDVVILSGGRPIEAPAEIPLDRPLDISVPMRPWGKLSARAHDGRRISLSLEPEPARDIPIDAAVLIDRSGSMEGSSTSARESLTKYEAVRAGLTQAAKSLTGADRLRLFAFDNHCEELGVASDQATCAAALAAAGEPRGGTEIGEALRAVLSRSKARDIVMITDGKSHALDVSALLLSGRRFTVVLIGDDSLEARVGELAAGSGGALLVAHGHAVREAVTAALATLRSPHAITPALELPLRALTARRDRLEIETLWTEGEAPEGPISDAVRALATALALPRLSEADAADLAVAEGLVGRWTSLVLVDEASQKQEGLPVTYKAPLPQPATAGMPRHAPRFQQPSGDMPASAARPIFAAPAARPPSAAPARPVPTPPSADSMPEFLPRFPGPPSSPAARPPFPPKRGPVMGLAWPSIEASVWNAHGTDLANGKLDALPARVATQIRGFAADPDVLQIATKLNRPPLLAAIGILARRAGNVWATRVANAIFRGLSDEAVVAVIANILARGDDSHAATRDRAQPRS